MINGKLSLRQPCRPAALPITSNNNSIVSICCGLKARVKFTMSLIIGECYMPVVQIGLQTLCIIAAGRLAASQGLFDPIPVCRTLSRFVAIICLPALQFWLLAIKTDMRNMEQWRAVGAFMLWTLLVQIGCTAWVMIFERGKLSRISVHSVILAANNTGILAPVVLAAAVDPASAAVGMLATIVLYFQQLPVAMVLFEMDRMSERAQGSGDTRYSSRGDGGQGRGGCSGGIRSGQRDGVSWKGGGFMVGPGSHAVGRNVGCSEPRGFSDASGSLSKLESLGNPEAASLGVVPLQTDGLSEAAVSASPSIESFTTPLLLQLPPSDGATIRLLGSCKSSQAGVGRRGKSQQVTAQEAASLSGSQQSWTLRHSTRATAAEASGSPQSGNGAAKSSANFLGAASAPSGAAEEVESASKRGADGQWLGEMSPPTFDGCTGVDGLVDSHTFAMLEAGDDDGCVTFVGGTDGEGSLRPFCTGGTPFALTAVHTAQAVWTQDSTSTAAVHAGASQTRARSPDNQDLPQTAPHPKPNPQMRPFLHSRASDHLRPSPPQPPSEVMRTHTYLRPLACDSATHVSSGCSTSQGGCKGGGKDADAATATGSRGPLAGLSSHLPSDAHSEPGIRHAMQLILSNGLMWTTGAATVVSMLGLHSLLDPEVPSHIPELRFVDGTLSWLARCSVPVSLFALGLFTASGVSDVRSVRTLVGYLAVKLLLLPWLMIFVNSLLGLEGRLARALVVLTCVPVGQNAFLVTEQFGEGAEEVTGVMQVGLLLMLPHVVTVMGALRWLGLYQEDTQGSVS